MIMALGAADENCLLASKIYRQKFPQQGLFPNKEVFERLKLEFFETGSVKYPVRHRSKPVTSEENRYRIMLSVVEEPTISQRIIERQLDISKSSVQRILHSNKFHPYKIKLHQKIFPEDLDRRLNFCNWANAQKEQNPNFFDFVLFSDEATFHSNGMVNRHNFHYYSDSNPRNNFTLPNQSQNRWSLHVWAGILGKRYIIGPYFFEGNLTGVDYLRFLQEDLLTLLENVPLNIIQNIWLQHDGAPAHYSEAVRNFLNQEYTGRWIGRGSEVPWPPRSPDLTSLDFFLWGYTKNEVFKTPCRDADEMKARIRNVFASINDRVLQNVQNSFFKRINICIEQNGGIFEPLLK